MITDANDASYSVNNSSFSSLPVIEDKDPLAKELDASRINQQMLIPTSVKSRILGDIISSTTPTGSSTPTTSQLTTVHTGGSQSFLFTVADSQRRAIVAIPEPAIYIGGVAPNNLWPSATYNMANVPVCVFNDPTLSDGNNIVTRVEVGNNTLTDLAITVTCSWRIITQPNTVFTPASATPTVVAVGA